jgi:hypothetical protein
MRGIRVIVHTSESATATVVWSRFDLTWHQRSRIGIASDRNFEMGLTPRLAQWECGVV